MAIVKRNQSHNIIFSSLKALKNTLGSEENGQYFTDMFEYIFFEIFYFV